MSVALMLAELSIIRTNRCPVAPVPLTCGPARANIASATARSWRNNNKFRRNRWNRLLTCRSSRLRRHKSVLDTRTGRRLSLRKYSAMIPTGTPANADHAVSPSGVFNSIGKLI